jgi:hypothetical protein
MLGAAAGAAAEAPCPAAATLPAYAHNDYDNTAPLVDALRLGYRGVEADVFLVDGELRVGHDRRRTRPGRTLGSLYLEPLRAVVARCGRGAFAPPFLLNVEIKLESPATYDSLRALLGRYAEILTTVQHGAVRPGPIEVVLVGWHPPLEEMAREPLRLARVQQAIVGRSAIGDTSDVVGLVGLNYGKTIRWSGRGPVPAAARAWLEALARAKRAGPNRIARVHNVPPRAAIYRLLLESGVDLVGTEDLDATRHVLAGMRPIDRR